MNGGGGGGAGGGAGAGGGMPGAGGGASTTGPSTGTTYKYGVLPGQGANREDLAKKRKPAMVPSEKFRPPRKRSGGKNG